MKKQAVSDIRQTIDKFTSYLFDVAPCKDMKGAVPKRKHINVPKSRVGGSGL